jgi:nucleotide-binding universal stress UspA family protein
MFDLILVPLDGSQLAECVLPHAVAFARSFDTEVTLLRMMEKNQTGPSAQLFDLLNWQINKTRARLYLEKTRKQFQESGLRARTFVLEGLDAEGISEFAQSQGMKLIILSSHGRNGITQRGISSVTQKIILSAPSSLLIVRANQASDAPTEWMESPGYQRILVPLDGSQRAENVLPIIKELAHFHKSQIHLAQIIQIPEMVRQMPPTSDDIDLSNRIVSRNQEEAAHYLEQVKSRSLLEGIQVQTHLLTSASAAISLHKLAEQEQIDLIALSAHGYSGNHEWPYGGMVNNFIHHSKISLLIVQDLPLKRESIPVSIPSGELAER